MENQTKSVSYQQALTLAEAGQHDQALRLIRTHLQTNPNDPEALNDAGTILFCMNRGAEAIELLEKAKVSAQGDLLSQILWNLCEAYLQEDRPAEAASLFDVMEQCNILNIEILNRAADVFLQREALGGAMECLLRSLSIENQQEILHPIVEIIRSKRPAVTLSADNLTVTVQAIYNWFNPRFKTQLVLAEQRQIPNANGGLTIVVGAGQMLRILASQKQTAPNIVVLMAEDVYHASLEQICWDHIDHVLLCGTSVQMDTLTGRIPDIHKKTHLQMTDEPLDISDWAFVERTQGKRLAAVGPFDAHHSPAFLLQCMQKLNYLDRDYRLYLAGGFKDLALEQYCRHMISRLNLDGIVVIENPAGNLSTWLRDKQYIVHTSTLPDDIRMVWTAMACGLKPVIGAFAGCDEVIDSRYVFQIAEEFCSQIRDNDYQPRNYRNWIEQRTAKQGFFKGLYQCLSKAERQITLEAAHKQQAVSPVSANPSFIPTKQTVPAFKSLALNSNPTIDVTPKSAPAAPIQWRPSVQPSIQSQPSYKPQQLQPQSRQAPIPAAPQMSSSTVGKSINQVAEDALKASRRLRELILDAEQGAKSEDNFTVPFVR
jgi:glycosyltransferase involved in cell wall biosynthesis